MTKADFDILSLNFFQNEISSKTSNNNSNNNKCEWISEKAIKDLNLVNLIKIDYFNVLNINDIDYLILQESLALTKTTLKNDNSNNNNNNNNNNLNYFKLFLKFLDLETFFKLEKINFKADKKIIEKSENILG